MLSIFKTLFPARRRRGLLIAAASALALFCFTGCSVGPDYVRPPTASPPAYKENEGWKVAQPQDELPRGNWWEIYHDPQLNSLEEQVEINNQNIAQAEANFRQALAQIRVARAAYFPTITGGASWLRFRNSENLGSGTKSSSTGSNQGVSGGSAGGGGFGSFTGQTQSNYLLTSNASWELDLWGKVRRNVESAKASAESSAATLEGARLSAQTTVAQNYFLIRSLDEQKRLLDSAAADFKKVLDLTKNRYASGVASRNDMALAETQYKNTQAQAIDLGVQRAQLEHAVATLLGKPASVFSIPKAPVTWKVPLIPVGVPSQLLERRPDIAAAERNMAAANAQIGVALAAYFPTVTLTGSGGLQASDPAMWLVWPSRFWSLGASATQTLFTGGLRGGQTASARAAYDAAVAAYRQTVLTGFQEVEDNLAALRILEGEYQVQEDAVKAARLSVTFSANQYQAGTISTLDFLAVEVIARNNERSAIVIQGNRMSASVLLISALGGGWQASDLPRVSKEPQFFGKSVGEKKEKPDAPPTPPGNQSGGKQ